MIWDMPWYMASSATIIVIINQQMMMGAPLVEWSMVVSWTWGDSISLELTFFQSSDHFWSSLSINLNIPIPNHQPLHHRPHHHPKNDKAIIWSKLQLGVDTHQMDTIHTMIGERLQIKPHLLSHTSVTLLSQLLQRTFYARPIRWRIVDIANAMLATVTIATIATVMLMESFFW